MNGCLALLLCLVQQTDDPLARGQKYLDKVAAVWSSHLPVERIVGVYFGRKWMGYVRLTVKASPEESRAAFEATMSAEANLMNRPFKAKARILLARDLSPVHVDSWKEESGKKETKTLTVEKGRWTLRREREGAEAKTSEGELKPGCAWDAKLLPFFAVPDDESVDLISLNEEEGLCRFTRLAEKRARSVEGKPTECTLLQIQQTGKGTDLCYLAPDGGLVEIAAGGSPARMRPITEAEIGKDLVEAPELKPAERALVDLFLAIQRNDLEALRAAFDWERLAAEMIEGYAEMTDEQKAAAARQLQEQLETDLLELRMPDAATLEEGLISGVKSTEKDGIASVKLFGETWKLHEVKGKWLVIAVER
ncbi:MAG: hypothetical protein HYY16_06650 [Planctomycetes bacterium]|nr:hypothetical protein [Planctomycetota bacterium]